MGNNFNVLDTPPVVAGDTDPGAEQLVNKNTANGYVGSDANNRAARPPKTHDHSAAGDQGGTVAYGSLTARTAIADEAHSDGTDAVTGKTAVATLAIPTTVAVGDRLDIVCAGDTLQNAGGTTLPEFKIGATAITQSGTALVALSIGNAAARRSWRFAGSIYVFSTTSQFVDGILTFGIASGVGSTGNAFQISGAATEDLAAGKNFVLSFTLSAGGATQDIVCHAASLSIIKK